MNYYDECLRMLTAAGVLNASNEVIIRNEIPHHPLAARYLAEHFQNLLNDNELNFDSYKDTLNKQENNINDNINTTLDFLTQQGLMNSHQSVTTSFIKNAHYYIVHLRKIIDRLRRHQLLNQHNLFKLNAMLMEPFTSYNNVAVATQILSKHHLLSQQIFDAMFATALSNKSSHYYLLKEFSNDKKMTNMTAKNLKLYLEKVSQYAQQSVSFYNYELIEAKQYQLHVAIDALIEADKLYPENYQQLLKNIAYIDIISASLKTLATHKNLKKKFLTAIFKQPMYAAHLTKALIILHRDSASQAHVNTHNQSELLFQHPQHAISLAGGIAMLEKYNLLTRGLDYLRANPKEAFYIGFIMGNLKKHDLLTPANLNTLLANNPHLVSLYQGLVNLNRASLATKNNLLSLVANSAEAKNLAEQIIQTNNLALATQQQQVSQHAATLFSLKIPAADSSSDSEDRISKKPRK